MKTPAFILSIAMAFIAASALAQQPGMKVNVLVVESADDFQQWLQKAADATQGSPGTYPPSLREVPAGKKVHFPIVVGGLLPPAQGVVTLVADVDFIGPDGKSIGDAKQCCKFTITNRPDIRTAMLGPTMNLVLETGDPNGTYTVRVSVTDGTREVAASETFQYNGGKGATGAPRLRMGTPPAKNPGDESDRRDCLSLPTPSEVIKCSERKR